MSPLSRLCENVCSLGGDNISHDIRRIICERENGTVSVPLRHAKRTRRRRTRRVADSRHARLRRPTPKYIRTEKSYIVSNIEAHTNVSRALMQHRLCWEDPLQRSSPCAHARHPTAEPATAHSDPQTTRLLMIAPTRATRWATHPMPS